MLKTIFGKPAKEYLGEHFKDIHEVRSDRFLKTNKKVKFEDFNVEGIVQDDKYLLAKQLIQREGARKILIFCQQGEEAIEIAKFLSSEGIPSEAFHAKQSDGERSDSLFKFNADKIVCLVATDLACRGIDFKDVKLVIQFNYADNGINLLHRIGRTGRMGTSGKGSIGLDNLVISFVDKKDNLLYNEFTSSLKDDTSLDQIFSRNRSFSKTQKRKHEVESKESNS